VFGSLSTLFGTVNLNQVGGVDLVDGLMSTFLHPRDATTDDMGHRAGRPPAHLPHAQGSGGSREALSRAMVVGGEGLCGSTGW
jgi:hypothetical protein